MIGNRHGAPQRRSVLPRSVTTAAAMVVVTGCTSVEGSSPKESGWELHDPRSLQVQAVQISEDSPLTITAGGIGSGPLQARERTADVRSGGAVEELPEGRHAQVVDLDNGELVRAGSLPGGLATADPLEDGSYRIGLLEVSEGGWIDGIGTTTVEVQDGMMTVASLESGDRGLALSSVAVRDDGLRLEVGLTDPETEPVGSWRLLGPGGERTGTSTGRELEIPSVPDGAYELEVRVGTAEAPQIVTHSVRSRLSVEDGEVNPRRGPGPAPTSAAPAAPETEAVSAAPASRAEQRPGDLPTQR